MELPNKNHSIVWNPCNPIHKVFVKCLPFVKSSFVRKSNLLMWGFSVVNRLKSDIGVPFNAASKARRNVPVTWLFSTQLQVFLGYLPSALPPCSPLHLANRWNCAWTPLWNNPIFIAAFPCDDYLDTRDTRVKYSRKKSAWWITYLTTWSQLCLNSACW